jgi:hypothetical protein
MTARLARYLFTEAQTGTAPTALTDTGSATVQPLTITYGATSAWSAIAAGKGLTGNNATQRLRAVSANLSGTKIGNAINGSKTLTTEFVYSGTPVSGQVFLPLFIANDALSTYPFSLLFVESGGNVNIEMYASGGVATDDTIGFVNGITLTSPTVVRVDIDTAQAVAANRIKVWLNGSAQTITSPGVIQDSTFSISGTDKLFLMGADGAFGDDGLVGSMYYLTLGTTVPSPTDTFGDTWHTATSRLFPSKIDLVIE